MLKKVGKKYFVEQNSVKKAVNLFRNTKKRCKETKFGKNKNKYSHNCSDGYPVAFNTNKKLIALGFFSAFAITEMRLCLMTHDWLTLQKLFSLLLELPRSKESLVWRYILTILLHSPLSDEISLEDFFNACINCQIDNFNYILDKLITLRKAKNSILTFRGLGFKGVHRHQKTNIKAI